MARHVRKRQMTAAVQDASRSNERVGRKFTYETLFLQPQAHCLAGIGRVGWPPRCRPSGAPSNVRWMPPLLRRAFGRQGSAGCHGAVAGHRGLPILPPASRRETPGGAIGLALERPGYPPRGCPPELAHRGFVARRHRNPSRPGVCPMAGTGSSITSVHQSSSCSSRGPERSSSRQPSPTTKEWRIARWMSWTTS